jgi:hypothetical protein
VVIVTPLSSYPSPWVTISDLMLALGLTAAAIGWLVVARPAGANGSGVGVAGLLFAPTPTKVDHEVGEPVGEPDLDTPRVSPPPAADDRGVVEIEYLTRASSFFVGWAWVVWVQDVETLVARSWRIFLFRDAWSYAGEFAFCAFFGPGFTLLLVRGHRWAGTSLRVDDGPGSRHVWQSLLASVGVPAATNTLDVPSSGPSDDGVRSPHSQGSMRRSRGSVRLPPRGTRRGQPRRLQRKAQPPQRRMRPMLTRSQRARHRRTSALLRMG